MVEAFVNDPDPQAYEKLVDRLLASPAWGEHRTRYWLDYARYADTHGIHFDNYREMWPYRQNVTEAFNRNQPFDQFTIEQIAGDLLPNRTLEQQIASGFNRCNITTNEGGAIAEEYLVLYARDRVEATSAGLAGPDHRLRRVPRPQVRSGLAEGVLSTRRLLQQHHAERDGRQHRRDPAHGGGAAGGGPGALGRPGRSNWPRPRKKWRSRQQFGPPGIRNLAGQNHAGLFPGPSCAPATSDSQCPWMKPRGRRVRADTPTATASRRRRRASPQWPVPSVAMATASPRRSHRGIPRQRRIRTGQALLLRSVGQNSQGRPLRIRRSPAWTKAGISAAGIFILESGRIGTHLIINGPADAIKVVSKQALDSRALAPRVRHLRRLQQGGRHDHLCQWGAQPIKIEIDDLKSSIQSDTPFKLGQRKRGIARRWPGAAGRAAI